jgi:hypothetical protein
MTKEQKVLVLTLIVRHLKGIVSAIEKWLELEKQDA